MRKIFAVAALAVFSFSAAQAQQEDKMLFNHLSVGITTGTPGLIGFDVATTCTPYLQIRAGIAIMPKFKYNTTIKMNGSDVTKFNNDIANINNALANDPILSLSGAAPITERVANEYDVQGKIGFTNGKLMFDFFPFKATGFPFFITVGAYFGSSEIISVYNKVDGALQVVNQANAAIVATKSVAATYGIDPNLNPIFAEVGDYRLGPDLDGNAKFNIKVNGFKPYLGIGFGRPMATKKRIGFSCEIGCMFWSKPKVTYTGYDNMGNTNFEIDKDKAGDKDVGKAIDIISKFGVWPCINFRLTGRIF